MKQQQHDINLRRTRKKSESQMGFEPTTLRDLVSMVSKGQFVGLDWNRITRLHSQVMIGMLDLSL